MAAWRGQLCLPRLQNRPARPQARMGRDQHTPRTAGPEGSQNPTHQSSASPVELHPMVEPLQRPQVPKPLWNLSGTESPQAGGPGNSDRPELEAALLWGCLWDCSRIPVLPMDLPGPASSEQSLPRGTGFGILCWRHPMAVLYLFTPQCVTCPQFSTAKFPHLGLQSPE